MTMTLPEREARIEGLSKLVEFLREHPAIVPPSHIFLHDPGTPAETKRAVEGFVHGAEGLVTKSTPYQSTPDTLRLERHFGDLTVWLDISKENLGCRKVTKMVEVEGWECGPLLSGIKEK